MIPIGLENTRVGFGLSTFYLQLFDAAIRALFWEAGSEEEKSSQFTFFS